MNVATDTLHTQIIQIIGRSYPSDLDLYLNDMTTATNGHDIIHSFTSIVSILLRDDEPYVQRQDPFRAAMLFHAFYTALNTIRYLSRSTGEIHVPIGEITDAYADLNDALVEYVQYYFGETEISDLTDAAMSYDSSIEMLYRIIAYLLSPRWEPNEGCVESNPIVVFLINAIKGCA